MSSLHVIPAINSTSQSPHDTNSGEAAKTALKQVKDTPQKVKTHI